MKHKTCTGSLVVAAIIVAMSSGRSFASGEDDHIVAMAKQSFVFETYLGNDGITVTANDGVAP